MDLRTAAGKGAAVMIAAGTLAGVGTVMPRLLESGAYVQIIRKRESLQAEWVRLGSGVSGAKKAYGVRVNWGELELEFYCRSEGTDGIFLEKEQHAPAGH